MLLLPRVMSVLLLLTCLQLSSSADAATPSPAHRAAGGAQPVHRVVWDTAPRGVRIVAADEDGSDRTLVYRKPGRGYVLNLAMSPDGRRVAFEPVGPGKHPARLVVASTTRTDAVDLLAGHDGINGIGTIGWSPNGERLVFEGYVDEESAGYYYPSYLFTIDLDGSHLVRGRLLDDGHDNGSVFGGMAWRQGRIAHPEDGRIRLLAGLRGSKARIVAKRVGLAYPSGDGRLMYFTRRAGPMTVSLWRMRADGTERERVLSPQDLGRVYGFAPDRTGERLLLVAAVLDDDGHETGAVHTVVRDLATDETTELTFTGQADTITWS